MNDIVVVDANVFVSLFDETDVWHNVTNQIITECEKRNIRFVILDCIVDETVSVLIRRLQNKKKLGQLNLYLKRLSEYIHPQEIRSTSSTLTANFDKILALISESNGALSFTDALIVFFLQEKNITRLLSFDSDFDFITTIQRISSPQQLRE